MDDRYTLELERAIYNFQLEGENANLEPVSNALSIGLAHNMGILLPIKNPGMSMSIFNPKKGYSKDYIENNDDHLHVETLRLGDGRVMIPVFTSREELELSDYPNVGIYPLSTLIEYISDKPACTGIAINPFNIAFNLYWELIQIMTESFPKSTIEIVRAGVTGMHVGAIVNAANSTLLGGGGVDGAIHRLAGPMLREECRLFGGCDVGNAVITGSYNIDYVDAIIHTVGPVYHGRPEDRIDLANCYLSSLDAASENNIFSVAFPCISTGAYGYPLAEAAKISLMAIHEWFQKHDDKVMNVYICCYRDEEYQAYMDILKNQPK